MAKDKKTDGKAPAKKEAKVKKEVKKIAAPPSPPRKVGGIVNPMLEDRTCKQGMALSILNEVGKTIKDQAKAEELAALLIRRSGIPYKHGITEDKDTDARHNSEWSGHGYLRWAKNNSDYPERGDKQKERYEKTVPFAKALVKSVNSK